MVPMSEHDERFDADPDPTERAPRTRRSPEGAEDPAFAQEPFRGHTPLHDEDPVRVGDFWLDSRLVETAAGIAYAAHEDGADSVMLLLLREGAADDPAARSRFSGEINAMHIDTVVARGGQDQDEGRMRVRFRPEDDDPQVEGLPPAAPWVALAFDGSRAAVGEAARVLHAVDLDTTPPLGTPVGPDFQLHWRDRAEAGRTRLWPLSWPHRRDRAGWITILTSWLLMLLLTALALLLAILVFQNAPLVSPPPPVPSPTSGGSGSEPASEPQSDGSGGSPSGPATPDDSFTPTMGDPDDEGSDGAGGEPTPNRRL